jgi:hypothetical protein
MNPEEQIPEFLIERLEPLNEETLLAVASYAESDGVPPDEVPDDFSTSFALQDDETLQAIATFSRNLAENSEETNAEESESSAADDEAEDDEQGKNTSLFSNGW